MYSHQLVMYWEWELSNTTAFFFLEHFNKHLVRMCFAQTSVVVPELPGRCQGGT